MASLRRRRRRRSAPAQTSAADAAPSADNPDIASVNDVGANEAAALHDRSVRRASALKREPARSRRAPPMRGAKADAREAERYAALDLGTNNCRLLIASPRGRGFRIFDAFSRIVRLGEGVIANGALSEAAMARTLDALKACAEKIERRGVTRMRCIATQACRAASNGREFLARVERETGLVFEIIAPEEEARLAVSGCYELIDHAAPASLVFDIGGGSTEISWVRPRLVNGFPRPPEIAAWTSMPLGVVNLSERYGGREMSREAYRDLVEDIRKRIAEAGDPAAMRALFADGAGHYVGTSGTVTSIAGVHLGLARYRRDRVDGLWLSAADVRRVSERLRAMSYEERAAEPCIGEERADLVICGCAILEALLIEWPSERVRVADRGLREGILVGLANERSRERTRRRRRRKRSPAKA